jgi:hypothetical protein
VSFLPLIVRAHRDGGLGRQQAPPAGRSVAGRDWCPPGAWRPAGYGPSAHCDTPCRGCWRPARSLGTQAVAGTDRKSVTATTGRNTSDVSACLPNRRACPIAGSRMGGRPYRLVMHGSPGGPRPIAARAGDTGALVRHGTCSITPVATGGRSRNRGPPARRSDERRGGGARFAGTAAVGAAEKRALQFPGMVRVCPPARGRPDYAVLVSGKSLPMVNAGDEVLRCARPGCARCRVASPAWTISGSSGVTAPEA